MKPVAQQGIREVPFQLLKETFEGPAPQGASAFLNRGTGLVQTLDEIDADAASPGQRGVAEAQWPPIQSTTYAFMS